MDEATVAEERLIELIRRMRRLHVQRLATLRTRASPHNDR
jgi:hypothetical protein